MIRDVSRKGQIYIRDNINGMTIDDMGNRVKIPHQIVGDDAINLNIRETMETRELSNKGTIPTPNFSYFPYPPKESYDLSCQVCHTLQWEAP